MVCHKCLQVPKTSKILEATPFNFNQKRSHTKDEEYSSKDLMKKLTNIDKNMNSLLSEFSSQIINKSLFSHISNQEKQMKLINKNNTLEEKINLLLTRI